MKPVRPIDTLGGSFVHLPSPANPELHSVSDLWFPQDLKVPWHSHPGEKWEFYIQVSGAVTWEDRVHRKKLLPGDAYLVPPGVPHRLVEAHDERVQFQYTEVELGSFARRCMRSLANDLVTARRGMGLHVASGARLRPCMEHLLATIAQQGYLRDTRITLALQSLLAHLLEWLRDGDRLPERAERGEVLLAQHRIDQDPQRAWTLYELAAGTGLTGQQLCIRFGKDVGRTPHQYLLRVRIDRCCQQLADTDLSITAIASQLGFASSQHFARVFRQHIGSTPRDYRVARQRARLVQNPLAR